MKTEKKTKCEVCGESYLEALEDDICVDCKEFIYEEINIFGERLS